MSNHKTKEIILKRIEVDDSIAPVVKWLNSFPNVITRWSCEGDKKPVDDPRIIPQKPYVVFYCDDNLELAKIASMMHGPSELLVDYYKPNGCMRYQLRFNSVKDLESFIKLWIPDKFKR